MKKLILFDLDGTLLDTLDDLDQNGAVGSEMFDGFELLDRERAQKIFLTGRDEHGNFYSLAAWKTFPRPSTTPSPSAPSPSTPLTNTDTWWGME